MKTSAKRLTTLVILCASTLSVVGFLAAQTSGQAPNGSNLSSGQSSSPRSSRFQLPGSQSPPPLDPISARNLTNPPESIFPREPAPGGAQRLPIAAKPSNDFAASSISGRSYPKTNSFSQLPNIASANRTARNSISDSAPLAPEPGASPAGGASQSLLLDARRALANQDLTRAQQLIQQAKRSGTARSPLGDSPQRIETLLRRYSAVSAGSRNNNNPQIRREQAGLLLEQGDWLLKYGDHATAERLAQRATALPVQYGVLERTPSKLLADIQQAKGQRPTGGLPANSQFNAMKSVAGNTFIGDSPQVNPRKTRALQLTSQARLALKQGNVSAAQRYIREAIDLKVPNSQFAPNETRPLLVQLEIDSAAKRQVPGGIARAGYTETPGRFAGSRAGYAQGQDQTRNQQAQFSIPGFGRNPADGGRLLNAGLKSLEKGDRAAALKSFKEAWKYQDSLDPQQRQLLQDKLTSLQAKRPEAVPAVPKASRLDQLSQEQIVAAEKLSREVFREQSTAEQMKEREPRAALEKLQKLRQRISESQVDPSTRKHFVAILDRRVVEMEQYIEDHRTEIETNELNQSRIADVDARRQRRVDVDNELDVLVEKFNELMDELRFAEAEVVARQARVLEPDSPVTELLVWKVKFAMRQHDHMRINDRKEQGFIDQLRAVDESSHGFDDNRPFQFGDPTDWRRLSESRRRMSERDTHFSATDLQIYAALNNEQVDVKFVNRPLREVLDMLGATAGINIHLHEDGLRAEGVASDTPVTLTLNQPVSLKSALKLILENLRLSYVVQHEVVKVTSESLRDQNVYHRTYYVADLVIPIPNFVPSYNIGLPGAIAAAHNALGYGGGIQGSGSVPLNVAANTDYTNPVTNNPKVLANMGTSGLMGSARSGSIGQGPGGLGGAAAADFDSLIELITTTVAPDTWDEVGGPGSISSFETNLSLVVSQTQEVHEQIADLLEQLRRLQDLQVTIEVRFITLNDNFFERVGVDFDFEISDNSGLVGDGMGGFIGPTPPDDLGPTQIFGIDPINAGTVTGDLDLQFAQDSFTAAVPQFGGFDPATAANFGFAILSDIEVFFLLQAAQGDTRSNVLQAPKVTLFNGQSALISDTSQRPFVTSVIPVVGDFAAAHQPVIVVLSEGTSLSVQSVVTSDRRFVRLTLVPFFSSIGNVQEFTFDGKKTTTSNAVIRDADGNPINTNSTSEVTEGTTVQLPTFNFTSVSTTVSVPDGGTVLLGGIKRLSEGRTERGVPLMSKIPYVNRLFKNVGIGRQTNSLMMMVTPRIIIQEEEELDQTGLDSSQLPRS